MEIKEIIVPSSKIIKSAKELAVFRCAYTFSLELHQASLKFPKIEQFALADQLRRSSKSVCANIMEGFSRQSQPKLEFKRFLTIAIGSANETELWIDYAFDLKYIDHQTYQSWSKTNNAVLGMLVKFRSKI